VNSLARPGGNVTGVFLRQIELIVKRMELFKETLPSLTRLAILWDAAAGDQFKAAEAASRRLGIRVHSLELRNAYDDLREAFTWAARDHSEALFVLTTASSSASVGGSPSSH
jgi:ABC-type uncharacterized transport system substrate-binding protein